MHINIQPTAVVKKALRFSTAEGMAYGAFLGFGDHFIVAYAVALQANNFLIGILCSLPGFLASLAQLWDGDLARIMKSRKKLVMAFALLQGLMFIPMMALFFFPRGSQGWWLVLFVCIYSIFGALVSPAWGSLMADVVPNNLRGRYFSLRGGLSTLTTIVTFLLGGLFLNFLVQRAMWGFVVLFGAALLARLVSFLLLARLYEKPTEARGEAESRLTEFVRGLPSTNLGKYMIFLFAMSFVVSIASPYFAVYQLRDLKFSYLAFAALETVSSVATLLTIRHWGRAADRAGNLKMMYLASALIPLVPLLWAVSSNLAYLGLVQAFSGFAWAGFSLCSVNYLYDATARETRTRYLGYFNAGNGMAAGLGALLGGYLATHLPAFRGYQILSLFLISGILRGAVSIILLRRLKEVRRVSDIPAAELFHIMMGGRPVNRRISHRRTSHFHDHEPAEGKTDKPSS